MKFGPRKIYNKSKCWHRHGKHKGRHLAALILDKTWKRPDRSLESLDLNRAGRI